MRRILLLLAAMTLVVAACGSDDSADTTTTTAAETTTTTAAETTSTTAAETTSTTAVVETTPIVPGGDADADAIAELYLVVFDSSTSFEDKAPLIVDPVGLESTVEAYAAAGAGVGGIMLQAKEVGVDGDLATVIYDLLFAENPFQSDQIGSAERTDGTWQVSREFFCSIMELARVGCP